MTLANVVELAILVAVVAAGNCFLYEAELTRLGVRNALISRSGSSQISKLLLDLLQTLKPSFMQQLF